MKYHQKKYRLDFTLSKPRDEPQRSTEEETRRPQRFLSDLCVKNFVAFVVQKNCARSECTLGNTDCSEIAYSTFNSFKNFSEFAFTLGGGFILSDFLKLAIAFFLSPLVA
jgi:hypothetical protein